jgi:hypothetical protein
MHGKDGLRLGKNYILHGCEKNAIQELEWLKLQLAVDEEEIELMVLEAKNENIILRQMS